MTSANQRSGGRMEQPRGSGRAISNTLRDYGGFDIADAEAEQKRLEESKTPSEFLSLDDGDVATFRVMPASKLSRRRLPSVSFYKHAYEDPFSKKFMSYACPALEAKDPCPTCDESARLRKSGRSNKIDADLSWDMKAKERVMFNVFVRSIEHKDGTVTEVNEVKIWEVSTGTKGKSMYEKLLALRKNKRAGGDWCDPTEEGFDVILSRRGEGRNGTTYDLGAARDRCPLHDDEDQAVVIIESGHDLEEFAKPPTPEQLAQLLGVEDAAPAPRGRVVQAPTAPARVDARALPRGQSAPPSARDVGTAPTRPSRTAQSVVEADDDAGFRGRRPPAPAKPADEGFSDDDDFGFGGDDVGF